MQGTIVKKLHKTVNGTLSETFKGFFTKAIGNLRSFKYNEQLQYLNLDSLQCSHVLQHTTWPGWSWVFMFFMRSQYPSTRGNLFKLAKLPVVSERDENFSIIVLLIYGTRYLIILLRLFLSRASNGTLMNLIFPIFFCSNHFVLAT